ncbi:hypothetical protein ACFO3J_30605 [Streptomyces polygonati]|uniref:Uncharacterized protein n=1 Tax=Streptomyces polygonati TaxID=1617087 RepID=A0ABV8HZW1_9ACTN
MLRAYESVLGWRLLAEGEPVRAEEVDRLLNADPNMVLRTPCTSFDLVSVPHELGLDALVVIERADVRVPCVRGLEKVTFLVELGTGQALADVDFVRVVSGPDALLTLPPSSNTRWDTPPWLGSSPAMLPLLEATALTHALQKVARTYRGNSSR